MVQIRIWEQIRKQVFSIISWEDRGFQLDSKDFPSVEPIVNKNQLSKIHIESNLLMFLGQIVLSS